MSGTGAISELKKKKIDNCLLEEISKWKPSWVKDWTVIWINLLFQGMFLSQGIAVRSSMLMLIMQIVHFPIWLDKYCFLQTMTSSRRRWRLMYSFCVNFMFWTWMCILIQWSYFSLAYGDDLSLLPLDFLCWVQCYYLIQTFLTLLISHVTH